MRNEELKGSGDVHATVFSRVPMGSIVMRTVSPLASVKELGGTIPVPVIRKQPLGNELSRKRYSTSVLGSRFNSESATDPANSILSLRKISRMICVDCGRGLDVTRMPGPRAQLPSYTLAWGR